MSHDVPFRVDEAVRLIAATPGYADVARDLERIGARGGIRFAPALADRAHAGLLGTITLGPEALEGSVLSLAQTLVHEHYHLRRQTPFHKTASFWAGVFTGRPVMQAYEHPAYRAALDFLEAIARAFPEHADEAVAERQAVAASLRAHYGTVT